MAVINLSTITFRAFEQGNSDEGDVGGGGGGGGPDVTAPEMMTAVFSDSVVSLFYSEALESPVDSAAFDITINGTPATILSATVSGSSITITISETIVDGDDVLLDYTPTGTNDIQDAAGNLSDALVSVTVVGGSLYGSEDFEDNAITLPWQSSQFFPIGTTAPTVVSDPLSEKGLSLLLQADYASGYPTDYSGGSSNLQQTAISINPQYAHAGMDESGTPVYTGMETWYRFSVMAPSGNVFCNGESNWLTEWHDSTGGAGPKSSGMFAYGGFPLTSGGTTSAKFVHRETVDTGGGVFQNVYFPGGYVEDPNSAGAIAPAFTLDVWHDIVYHKIWHPNPSIGLVEWWVDGVQYASETLQTQATSDYYTWAFYNYRYNVTGTSQLYYDDILWGSTAASVGFTP